MKTPDTARAVAAGMATAQSLGLAVDDAVVLHNSNRLAVRLLPCDALARVADETSHANAAFEVEIGRRLHAADSPIAEPDRRVEPLVYVRDGFATTLWTYYEPTGSQEAAPREYAHALQALHERMLAVDFAAPHVTDRIDEAQRLVDKSELSPDLPGADRDFLSAALRSLRRMIVERGAPEQLLHGEPHAGNLLRTKRGLLFIDLQTCCRGPIEFDIAHCSPAGPPPAGMSWFLDLQVPEDVAAHYPAADPELVRLCTMLMLAMVAAWRWDRLDDFPNGRQMGIEFVEELRAALDRYGLNIHG